MKSTSLIAMRHPEAVTEDVVNRILPEPHTHFTGDLPGQRSQPPGLSVERFRRIASDPENPAANSLQLPPERLVSRPIFPVAPLLSGCGVASDDGKLAWKCRKASATQIGF